jgi:hypothetical protein
MAGRLTATLTGSALTGSALAALLAVGILAVPTAASAGQFSAGQFSAGPAPRTSSVHNNSLYGVSCTSKDRCMAVGTRARGTAANSRALAEQWNGARWRVLSMPGLAKRPRVVLVEVSCRSSRNCVAIGYHYSPSGSGDSVLAEQWNGTRWRVTLSRNPAGAANGFLNDVSCAGSNGCLAVGSYTVKGREHAVALRWRGRHWRFLPVPQPAGARSTSLNGVECRRGACMAVGQTGISGNRTAALAERWTGSAWQVLHAASPAGSIRLLQDVSCPAASLCVAVGQSLGSSVDPFAEIWRDGKWRLASSPRIPDGGLDGISCSSRKRCVAVGLAGSKALSEAWDGSAWRVRPVSHPSGPSADELSQVSCRTAHLCVAVGSRYHPSRFSGEATLAQSWNGARWQVRRTVNP